MNLRYLKYDVASKMFWLYCACGSNSVLCSEDFISTCRLKEQTSFVCDYLGLLEIAAVRRITLFEAKENTECCTPFCSSQWENTAVKLGWNYCILLYATSLKRPRSFSFFNDLCNRNLSVFISSRKIDREIKRFGQFPLAPSRCRFAIPASWPSFSMSSIVLNLRQKDWQQSEFHLV